VASAAGCKLPEWYPCADVLRRSITSRPPRVMSCGEAICPESWGWREYYLAAGKPRTDAAWNDKRGNFTGYGLEPRGAESDPARARAQEAGVDCCGMRVVRTAPPLVAAERPRSRLLRIARTQRTHDGA
jgi:hypothetical protein